MNFQASNYSLLKKIAQGGMGEIFLAKEIARNRIVVIKKISFHSGIRPVLLERFQNDLRNVSFLSHPNIITILDYGMYRDDCYLVMEHVDGCNLDTLINDPTFDRNVGLMIVLNALQALHFSHNNGVIHCDIKPSNILIDKSGRVVLSDFGLTRAIDTPNFIADFATPVFMPPEQAYLVSGQTDIDKEKLVETSSIHYANDLTPEEFHALTERGRQWDIWSVGVLLYRICSGYYPFNNDNFTELLRSIIYAAPVDINVLAPDVPHQLIKCISQCLLKEPFMRLQSLDSVINVIQGYIHSMGVFDTNPVIADYIKKRSYLYEFQDTRNTDISKTQQFKMSNGPQEEKWEFNVHIDKLTDAENAIRHAETIRFKVDNLKDIDPEINDVSWKVGEWEYREHKTLKFEPHRDHSVSATTELKDKKNIASGALFKNSLQSLLTVFNSVKDVLFSNLVTQVTIGVILFILLSVVGIVIVNSITGKHIRSRSPQHSVAYSKHESHNSRSIAVSDKNVNAVQGSNNAVDSVVDNSKNSLATSKPAVEQSSRISDTLITQKPGIQTGNFAAVNVIPGIAGSGAQTQKAPKAIQSKGTAKTANQITANKSGLLKIEVNPSDAAVSVNGETVSLYEMSNGKSMIAGSYTVTAEASGYQSTTRSVIVESDKTVILSLELKPEAKGNGQLHIYSYPWANLYIDGELVGTTPTPTPVLLLEGGHEVVLKRDGFVDYYKNVTVKTGDVLRLKIELQKAGQ